MSAGVHGPERADAFGIILGRGLLDPRQRLLVVHVNTTLASVVRVAELKLALRVTPLGTYFVRRHRPRVVDLHALAPVVGGGDAQSRFDVALSRCDARWEELSAGFH